MSRYVYLLLSVMIVSAIGCTPTDAKLPDETIEGSEVRVYEVFGMDCPGCQGGLEKLVKKIPSIQTAKANWVEKKLTVTVLPDTELKDEEIYDAIERANFTPGKRIK